MRLPSPVPISEAFRKRSYVRDFFDAAYPAQARRLATIEHKVEFVKHHTMIHEQMAKFYQGFRRDAHPMAVMVGVVGALSAFESISFGIICASKTSWNQA